jgi:hypothetical protein
LKENSFLSGLSATTASVVKIITATDAAFCNAERVTLVGLTKACALLKATHIFFSFFYKDFDPLHSGKVEQPRKTPLDPVLCTNGDPHLSQGIPPRHSVFKVLKIS